MRVVSGRAGGMRLAAPRGRDTRPTADRVREAMFNALGSLGADAVDHVLDGFAGSGALGIEALSRGAGRATFVERDRTARQVLAANLATTGLVAEAEIVGLDLLNHLAQTAHRYDLVLLDPPYAFVGWKDLLGALAPHLAAEAIVVTEADRAVIGGWGEILREKRYGGTVVQFARPPHDPRLGAPA